MTLAATDLSLALFVEAFAVAFSAVDAGAPVWVSRTGRSYQAGLGPHPENEVVRLAIGELRASGVLGGIATGQSLPYPDAPRQKCDLWLGEPLQWVIEVKMARFKGDNGKPDDMAIKDLISPYEQDRSALTDTLKLARSGFAARKALLIYGFDFEDRPLDPAIRALETLARDRVVLGERIEAKLAPLVHPVMSEGRLFAWEVGDEQL